MKKAMIESAVSQGIRQMKEDPERAARRMVDLGKQFSHNRFQDMIFSVIQELLDNDRSSYYDMLHNLLKNTDEKAIQKFGVNFGYMGWTYGASLIREKEKACGHCIPWAVTFRYDPAGKKGLTAAQLEDLIGQGQKLGIYVYYIREMGASGGHTLLEVFERCRDCAFVAFSHSGCLTAAQIEILKLCKNTVISLPVDDPESMLTASLLRTRRSSLPSTTSTTRPWTAACSLALWRAPSPRSPRFSLRSHGTAPRGTSSGRSRSSATNPASPRPFPPCASTSTAMTARSAKRSVSTPICSRSTRRDAS